MKLWIALTNAFAGWLLILRGDAGWRERFVLSWPGISTALIVYALLAFAAVILTSLNIGMPSLLGVVAAMLVLAIPLFALVLSVLLTRNMLSSRTPVLALMVPGTYLMTAFLLFEGFLALFGGPVVMLSWLALAYMLFRLGRLATDWNSGVSAGFAVLTVATLVAMRMALYMLSSVTTGSPT